ncbi:MAG: DUF2970 domain-containing protein [Thiobacillus sp.]|uniref:DUF2970 domain-containing protein n=1 Tax=unclassified Thiobacillus TaxID=2646513 RepID=UPI00086D83C4|nr:MULTISPECIES: DUF2970 domain-containing protein [unclassified Thiobacillus]MBD3812226.1 DUF2970 domain-containing protein [Betaproteobacteria bacterium]MBS0328616.1 DUF2970 domain-containing protein [Pseudomonadota bacterium]MBN8772094.1 DUF2970 domain-containing protein [Thiobacillus sp.]MBN8779552.1 DUF2970 domain-containing protein [Thiobacillus sp.]ODV00305.1 MAG: hypothetical protein ABT23_11865 [Thiobacillus sp. SCN 63-57]
MAEKGNLRAALAVFWSFFGVRKRRDYDDDAQSLTQAQIIIAGLVGGVVFVLTLLLVVYLVLQFVK